MYAIAVGQLYNPRRTRWPETQQWRLSEDAAELVMFYPSPTEREIEAVRTGRARFALLAGEHALALASKFGDLRWSDAFWQSACQTDTTAGLRSGMVQVILVDANTGVVKVIRITTWSAQFAQAVRLAIRTQHMNMSTREQGDAEIDAWLAKYPKTVDMVRDAHYKT